MQDPQAIWTPSPNYGNGRNGYQARWIILHGTAGPGSVPWLTNPASGVSATYVITRDGKIYQLVDENDWSWANGVLSAGHDSWWSVDVNPNWVTISIEHEKLDDQNASDLTPAQKAASFGLVARICQRWKIPARQADATGGITGHYSIDPVNRSRCPGTYPWAELWAYLKGGNMSGVPQGWTDANGKLTAPNGKYAVLGMRDAILNSDWDSGNVPLENEVHLDQVELHNTSLGAGQRQIYRDFQMFYTPATGVNRSYTGMELMAALNKLAQQDQQLQALAKQVADLKAAGADPSLMADMGQIYALAAKHHVQ